MADELTVARAQQRIARSMGWRRPSDWPAEHSITELLNEVGEWFVSVHDWNFLVRPPTYLALVNGQSYCELPDDFTQHIDIVGVGTNPDTISIEDPRAVARAQADGGPPGHYVACFTYGEPTTAGPKATARLELGPVPTSSVAQAFVLSYKGGWTTVNDASDHIVLPTWVTGLYVRACSVWLGGLEQEHRGSLEDRLDRLVGSILWQAAVERDDNAQQDLGQMRGGVGETAAADDSEWPFQRYTGAVPFA